MYDSYSVPNIQDRIDEGQGLISVNFNVVSVKKGAREAEEYPYWVTYVVVIHTN